MNRSHEFCSSDRYIYDWGLCSTGNGFAQVDTSQDASYYGTWANPFKLVVFAYVEGDCYTTQCETPEEFAAELRELKEWNTKHGWKFHGIDPGFNVELKAEFLKHGLDDLVH